MQGEQNKIFDALPGLIWTGGSDGHIEFSNQRWQEYTGLTGDSRRELRWDAAMHAEDFPRFIDTLRSNDTASEPLEVDARLRRFDGSYRWFMLRICRIGDPSEDTKKWCGVGIDIDERRRSEQALRASEKRFRLIVDGLPAIVTLMTPDGDLEFANRLMLEYLGAPTEELKARPTTQSFHPDDRPEVDARWKQSIATGCPYDYEARLRGANGEYRWFHTRGFPLRDEEGNIFTWHLLQNDIDDRKRAEFLLAAEKELLETVALQRPLPLVLEAVCRLVEESIRGSYCSIFLVDSKGTRLKHGAAPSLPCGFMNAIIGNPVSAEFGPCAMAAANGEMVVSADLGAETRWGGCNWPQTAMAHGLMSCWSMPILAAAGKVLGAFAIYYSEPRAPTGDDKALIDRFSRIATIAIERLHKDAALQQSEALLAETQRLTATGGLFWNLSTGERTWSREVFHIYGLDPSTEATLDLSISRIHPDDVAGFIEMRNRQSKDVADYTHDYRIIMPDGSIKYIHSVGQVTRDLDGEVGYNVALQDVTERRLSEEALGKARSELARVARISSLGALTASIAHEVSQPLSGIVTNASTCVRMLALDPPNIEGATNTARRTIRDANRASDVITRLRRLFVKKETLSEPVDLNEAAREVIALSLSDLQSRRILLYREFARDLPTVEGDRIQLQQVILNLLLNAADAMNDVNDRPRKLVIRTETIEAGIVRLSVIDTGVGLDPNREGMLFEPFYTTKSGGMGIGLSVSRSIIESHHGRLWAESNEGPGTTFVCLIPISHHGGTRRDLARSAMQAPQPLDRC